MVALWTSVNERLPAYGMRVLLWHHAGTFGMLHAMCPVCQGEDHFVSDDGTQCASLQVITHWSTAPKAPYTPVKRIRPTTTKRKIHKGWNSNLF